ncbi:MAG TPA: LysM peptidoglycan-binding domain-containing protein [Terriglobales bacterium]|nr:LysM peptidoglycan-binding domain-containing protein [Terriglobales bacterium]
MRIRQLYWFAPLLIALALGSASCQTAAKRQVVAIAPPLPVAPPIQPKPAAIPAPDPKPQEAPPPAVTNADPIAALVAQADEQYQAGQANYSAGHLEAAKANFDRAFDILTQAPGGASSDERLQKEFDKIVDGVNSLELVALRQGDGFTEQKSEPAPIDETNQITFPVDPNLKAKAAEEIRQIHSDLPLTMNDAVAGYVNYFSTRGRGVLERALTRAGLYSDMIRRVLKEEGVPQDLIYLAEAESGFHPVALSHVGARGLWQFMSSRARGYGLERSWWVDERQDPEKSTRAAARHLKDLYKEFGDWYLAMAAYNSGPLTVMQAVQRTGYADFWELYRRNVLPAETRNYVPIIIAVAIMAKNPAQYGLDQIVPDKPIPADTVTINYPVDLRLVAECVDTSVTTLQELNPSLLRMTTPREGSFDLHLPAGTTEKFQAAIAAIPRDKRVWWRYHTVTEGETLASVARSYHTTSRSIAEANSLDGRELESGTKLIIPVAAGREVEAIAYSRHLTRYRVRRGDTLTSVADDFGVPVARLRRWNPRVGKKLRPGAVLYLHRPLAPGEREVVSTHVRNKYKRSSKLRASASGNKKILHKVRQGETLYSIANQYNTTVAALRRTNGKVAANLRAGAVLVIQENP